MVRSGSERFLCSGRSCAARISTDREPRMHKQQDSGDIDLAIDTPDPDWRIRAHTQVTNDSHSSMTRRVLGVPDGGVLTHLTS